MNMKAIFWACGATATLVGLILGFRNALRGRGLFEKMPDRRFSPSWPDDRQMHLLAATDDPLSPDAFRDELLK